VTEKLYCRPSQAQVSDRLNCGKDSSEKTEQVLKIKGNPDSREIRADIPKGLADFAADLQSMKTRKG